MFNLRLLTAKTNIKKRNKQLVVLTFVTLNIISFSTSANWFIEGHIGKSKTSQQTKQPNNIDMSSSNINQKDNSYKFGAGYKFSNFTVSVNLEDLGEATNTFSTETTKPTEFYEQSIKFTPKFASGLSAKTMYEFWNNEKLNMHVGVGIFRWGMSYSNNYNGKSSTIRKHGTDFIYLYSANYHITSHTDISLSVSRYNFAQSSVNNLSLGLIYQF